VSGIGVIPYRTEFTPIALGELPGRDDSQPIAVLGTPPAGLTDVGVSTPPLMALDDPELVAYVLASLRYQFSGQTLYVTTLQPANLGLQRPLNLGPRYGDLGNGRIAYSTTQVVREGQDFQIRRPFNVVSFVENGLVVTLAGEMPSEKLIDFAKTVTFSPR
jgi:hypothetical protein